MASSSTKKLLITDPKPRLAPNCASSSSATSSPTQPLEKRTRDQPNLSDCHCCERRIIHSNIKDRLQPLDSVWRIVLLCRKCRRSVCSGQTCPYCFQETGNSGDLCTCRTCKRKIHKDCVGDYGKFRPWCYLGGGSEGFKVCLDCWVPELLKNSVQVLDRSGSRDLLENGKCEVENRVKNLKEQVSRRAKGTIDEVDLADDAYDKNDRDSSKAVNSSSSGETGVVDDAELAIQLHRVMNSSPRILRGKSLGSNSFDAPNIGIWKGISYKRSGIGKRSSVDQKLQVFADSAEIGLMDQTSENNSGIGFGRLRIGLIAYERNRKRKIWQLHNEKAEISDSTALKNLRSDEDGVRCSVKSGDDTSEDSVRANVGQSDSCVDGGRFGPNLLSYKRTKFRKKVCQLNDPVGVCGDYSSCGNIFSSLVKTEAGESLLRGSSNTKHDRFHMKYVKRTRGTKTDSRILHNGTFLSENKVVPPVNGCELILPNGTHAQTPDRYSIKYSKRVKSSNSGSDSGAKLHSNAFVDKINISAKALTTDCSAESRTLSDVSSNSSLDLPHSTGIGMLQKLVLLIQTTSLSDKYLERSMFGGK